MALIFIDGKSIETSIDKTIIEAAYDNGMKIPHFCWHPELSVSGNCRMCLVEIGLPKRLPDGSTEKDDKGEPVIAFFPKLQIACATKVSDGMHVRTKSDEAKKAQESVMEFLLINHPLDCPICDEAGQCKLQDYAFSYSNGKSRFIEEKNHKAKRVEWGPNVLFDGERCISCSRCIRFSNEIAKQNVLTFVNRGDHVTIKVADGKRLDNPYSMNVIDICPVGALTSKDFRFKARVWDMSFNDSICHGCSRGCNIKLGVRNNEILRIEPKGNPYVNKFWMCDYGRLNTYSHVNENRTIKPRAGSIRLDEKDLWKNALSIASIELKKYSGEEIAMLLTSDLSCEDIFLAQRLAREILRTTNIYLFTVTDNTFEDNFLRKANKTANLRGALELGLKPVTDEDISRLNNTILSKKIKAVLAFETRVGIFSSVENNVSSLNLLLAACENKSNLSQTAYVMLPMASYAESEGTVVNFEGRVQHFAPALVTAENIRHMGMKMSRLDKFGAPNDRWTKHENRNCRPTWSIVRHIANTYGANWTFKLSKDVFKEITLRFKSFEGMTYSLLDAHKGIMLGKGNNPDKIVDVYESHYFKPE